MKLSKFVQGKMQRKQVFREFGLVGFIQTLPQEDRLILTAVAICGMSFRKTAKVVKLDRATVAKIYRKRYQELRDFVKYDQPF